MTEKQWGSESAVRVLKHPVNVKGKIMTCKHFQECRLPVHLTKTYGAVRFAEGTLPLCSALVGPPALAVAWERSLPRTGACTRWSVGSLPTQTSYDLFAVHLGHWWVAEKLSHPGNLGPVFYLEDHIWTSQPVPCAKRSESATVRREARWTPICDHPRSVVKQERGQWMQQTF